MVTSSAPPVSPGATAPGGDGVNEVRLRGTLSAVPQVRELPSGDRLGSWRIVVPREQPDEHARPRHDTIDCVSFDVQLIDEAVRWLPGTQVQIEGSLRRRVFRAGGGLQSRYDVEAHLVQVITTPPEATEDVPAGADAAEATAGG